MEYDTEETKQLWHSPADEIFNGELGRYEKHRDVLTILCESQGFVDALKYDTPEEMDQVWDLLVLSADV
jgi:hypothetical protein|tara:strand:+ start:223 stop:429 length:207 start_codon:yes stop_codon:yes gene_type:complete